MFTAILWVDSGNLILSGRPHGEVAFLYKKSLCNKIKLIKSINRRVCGIQTNFNSEYFCSLLSVYLPCDNYTNTESFEYIECIKHLLILWIVKRLFVVEILILLSKDQTIKLHVLKVLSPGITYLYLGIILYQRNIICIPIFYKIIFSCIDHIITRNIILIPF